MSRKTPPVKVIILTEYAHICIRLTTKWTQTTFLSHAVR